jgi:hypothetical protein
VSRPSPSITDFDYAGECAQALDKLGEFVVGLAEPKVVPLRRA